MQVMRLTSIMNINVFFSLHYEGRPIDLHHDQEYPYDLYAWIDTLYLNRVV
jgi:hypothetical protein